jgi:hypothetical protein
LVQMQVLCSDARHQKDLPMSTRRIARLAIPLIVFVLGFASCAKKNDDISADNGAHSDAGVNQETLDCNSTDFRETKMVEVWTPAGRKYCIDEHEVTRGQYQKFAEQAGKQVSLQAPFCAQYNVDNLPARIPPEMGTDGFSWDPADAPMNFVHYCGATAYCSWVGKRLCGAVDGAGLTYELVSDGQNTDIKNADTILADTEHDQWFNVCSQGGTTTSGTKNISGCPSAISEPVSKECGGDVAPFDKVFGMYGGAGELVDFFGPAGAVVRAVAGGECAEAILKSPTKGSSNIGFRCCSK